MKYFTMLEKQLYRNKAAYIMNNSVKTVNINFTTYKRSVKAKHATR